MTPPGLWSYISPFDGDEIFSILVNRGTTEVGWSKLYYTLKNFIDGYYDLEFYEGSKPLHKFYLPLGAL